MTQREQVQLFGGHVAETAEEERQCSAFENWWRLYPKKVGKLAAVREWAKVNPSRAVCQQMVEALAWQVHQPAWTQDGGKWIPDPRKWLYHGRWMDQKPEPPPSGHLRGGCGHSPPCGSPERHALEVEIDRVCQHQPRCSSLGEHNRR